MGFSLWGLLLLESMGFRVHRLQWLRHVGAKMCGSLALEHRLSSRGGIGLILHGKWDLPGPGLEPIFPALAGRFCYHCTIREVPHLLFYQTLSGSFLTLLLHGHQGLLFHPHLKPKDPSGSSLWPPSLLLLHVLLGKQHPCYSSHLCGYLLCPLGFDSVIKSVGEGACLALQRLECCTSNAGVQAQALVRN